MIKKTLTFLLVMAVFCLAQVVPDTKTESICYKDSVKAEEYAKLTQVDFDSYYKNLIQQEEKQVQYDIFGIIASTASLGIGAAWWLVIRDNEANSHNNPGDDVMNTNSKLVSIALIAAGTLGVGYSLYAYNRDTGTDSKLRSYRNAYEVYKRSRSKQRSNTQIVVAPAVNVLNAAIGMNVLGQF